MLGDWIKQKVELSYPKSMSLKSLNNSLEKLKGLKHGWYDGEGEPTPLELVKDVGRTIWLVLCECPIPHIYFYPMIEGGIRAEFEYDNWLFSIDFLKREQPAYVHACHAEDQRAKESYVENWWMMEGAGEIFYFIEDLED